MLTATIKEEERAKMKNNDNNDNKENIFLRVSTSKEQQLEHQHKRLSEGMLRQ
jgi:hypothetical protein